jgi:hypothetical protein
MMINQAETDSDTPLALELDHVIIKSSRAEELFQFFRDVLMFPVSSDLKIGGLTTADQQFSLTYYRETFDPIERKRRMMHELKQRSGGPLGVLGAADIVIGASNHDEVEMIWTRILGNPLTPLRWKLTSDDPTLWLVPAKHVHLLIGITLRVMSIQAARNYLQHQSALSFDSDGAPCIRPAGTEGLGIKLIAPSS